MPKLPKGMFRRKPGGSWYLRLHRGGRDRWVSLGSDFRSAVRRGEELRSGVSSVLGGRVTAGQASQRWLEVFIQTRRNPKGQKMTEGRVRRHHVLRNALLAVLTYFGPLLAMLLTGSFVVEKIYAIPGMGRFFVTAVTNRDYPLVLGVTLVYAALVLVSNLIVDLLYAWLDPRIRVASDPR